jgi:hypothetical protein
METLRGFVDSVWTTDAAVHHPHLEPRIWSKPDTASESFELRRLTTTKAANGVRTDFFEFYWAHMVEGTTLGHVASWARTLLLRDPREIPRSLRGVWLVLLALVAGAAALLGNAMLPEGARFLPIPRWASVVAAASLLPFGHAVLRNVVGGAARYLRAAPSNIQTRHCIRAAGVRLLVALHRRGYERIVVVGHSLGSVIGYDVLTHAWARVHDAHSRPANRPEQGALRDLEEIAAREPFDGDAYRASQPRLASELRALGSPWRVTDFVTLGSPLAHAAILLAHDAEDLRAKQRQRELPTCPPTLELERRKGVARRVFSYAARFRSEGDAPDARRRRIRLPHHAAVFAPVRWTNLYFPSRWILWGDVIAGPLAPVFGGGIRDVALSTRQRAGLLSHTLYWTRGKGAAEEPHVVALRKALGLSSGEGG